MNSERRYFFSKSEITSYFKDSAGNELEVGDIVTHILHQNTTIGFVSRKFPADDLRTHFNKKFRHLQDDTRGAWCYEVEWSPGHAPLHGWRGTLAFI